MTTSKPGSTELPTPTAKIRFSASYVDGFIDCKIALIADLTNRAETLVQQGKLTDSIRERHGCETAWGIIVTVIADLKQMQPS